MEKYTKSLTEYQAKNWRDKVTITEKAVIKSKIKEIKTRCKVPASHADEVDTVAKENIEEARVDEVAAVKLPKPPAEDADGEAKMVKLKRKRRRRKAKGILDNTEVTTENLDASDSNYDGVEENKIEVKEVGEKETEVSHEILDKIEVMDDKNCNETSGKRLVDTENIKDDLQEMEAEEEYHVKVKENNKKVVDDNLDKTNENSYEGNDVCINGIGANYEEETVVLGTGLESERNLSEELMYKLPHGKEDKVAKGMDALMLVPLLQANLAVMLLCVKTLQEQSSRPSSMSSSLQPMAPLSSAQCSCLTQSRMCSKATTAITRKGTDMSSTGMVKRLIAKFDTGKLQ